MHNTDAGVLEGAPTAGPSDGDRSEYPPSVYCEDCDDELFCKVIFEEGLLEEGLGEEEMRKARKERLAREALESENRQVWMLNCLHLICGKCMKRNIRLLDDAKEVDLWYCKNAECREAHFYDHVGDGWEPLILPGPRRLIFP